MPSASPVVIFCEDIREEKSGQDSIIGTLPDNVIAKGRAAQEVTPNMRAFLPRLGLYLRINLDAAQEIPKEVSAKVTTTDGQMVAETKWDPSVIEGAFVDSRQKQMPLVGLIFKAVMAPFPLAGGAGKITAIVTIDGVDTIAGAINVTLSTA